MSMPVDAIGQRELRRSSGISLVELLTSLAITAFMLAGAVFVLARARNLDAALQANARLQETARYALAVIEPDVRMAGFWGLTNQAAAITASPALIFPPKCGGAAWVTDTSRYIDGTNNSYPIAAGCAALSGGARAGSDVLVVRRASARRIAPQSPMIAAQDRDRVLIITSRSAGQIFVAKNLANAIPAGYAVADPPGAPPLADTRELIVNAYYVSADSSVAKGFPALRRKTLTSGPDVGDEEIIAGIEDVQFEIGLDTTGDSSVDMYVNPGAVPNGALPVSVRLWLRLRAQQRESGYTDDRPTAYADRNAAAPNDSYRRLLVMKTIQLRNARR